MDRGGLAHGCSDSSSTPGRQRQTLVTVLEIIRKMAALHRNFLGRDKKQLRVPPGFLYLLCIPMSEAWKSWQGIFSSTVNPSPQSALSAVRRSSAVPQFRSSAVPQFRS
jgi:hypothetical protein